MERNSKVLVDYKKEKRWGDIDNAFIVSVDSPLSASMHIMDATDDDFIIIDVDGFMFDKGSNISNMLGISKMSSNCRKYFIEIIKRVSMVDKSFQSNVVEDKIAINFKSYKYNYKITIDGDDEVVVGLEVKSSSPRIGRKSYIMFTDLFIVNDSSIQYLLDDINRLSDMRAMRDSIEEKSSIVKSYEEGSILVKDGYLRFRIDGVDMVQYLSTKDSATGLYVKSIYPKSIFNNELILIKGGINNE